MKQRRNSPAEARTQKKTHTSGGRFRRIAAAMLVFGMTFSGICPGNISLFTAPAYAASRDFTGPEVVCLDGKNREVPGNWEYVGKEWRYRKKDGTYASSQWLYYQDKWYYADADGYLKTDGRVKLAGHPYYFDEDGAMITGWLLDSEDGRWYRIREDGSMTTGWVNAGGYWYLFDPKGRLYMGGRHMADGHLYTFHENGRLAAGSFIRTRFYNLDGIHDPEGDMILYGKRKPPKTEEDKLTEQFSEIPPYWVNRFREDGWQFMWYTDKIYLSAPLTDRGIWYVKYTTDTDYKKIKFTDPEAVRMGFGEYIAFVLGRTVKERDKMEEAVVGYDEFASGSSIAPSLPSYFADDEKAMAAVMFCGYFDPAVREEMRENSPELAETIEELLRVTPDRKPEEYELSENGGMGFGGSGPASERVDSKATGPAAEDESGDRAQAETGAESSSASAS
ncbi:MAG: N-acetylmuramoyl-L-alanine amidase family protein [[Clostridium] aminophilum]|uniref:N-acetylmuramoyl-L-alanine amidase family protein n=1 Tax=[Clostridium] aminophilum TaxID=1526 RepID=UPI0026ED093E|nr:N-acetylmuramoyl-L-alanine amidase family protein [[Clostridium] aminophilum]MDD6195675.1 N-acetylmuramoyl-L-alanine amidase family protein [[Clostridium] aminophilum]